MCSRFSFVLSRPLCKQTVTDALAFVFVSLLLVMAIALIPCDLQEAKLVSSQRSSCFSAGWLVNHLSVSLVPVAQRDQKPQKRRQSSIATLIGRKQLASRRMPGTCTLISSRAGTLDRHGQIMQCTAGPQAAYMTAEYFKHPVQPCRRKPIASS